jgi:phosphate-selective porin OprO/OprP
MTDYVHVLNINTSGVSNSTSKAWNDASLDMVETRFQVDW